MKNKPGSKLHGHRVWNGWGVRSDCFYWPSLTGTKNEALRLASNCGDGFRVIKIRVEEVCKCKVKSPKPIIRERKK